MKKKLVILLTIDALRRDHLKSYGYHRNTAPFLEKFVKRGTTFYNAFTNGPESPSSFASLFTGMLPLSGGGRYSPLPQEKIIFPQILAENNIYNYAIHSNPNLGSNFNYDRGFQEFYDGERFKTKGFSPKEATLKTNFSQLLKKILSLKGLTRKLLKRIYGFNTIKNWLRKRFPMITDILLPFTPMAYNAPYIINRISSFLNRWKGGNLFLWTHFMDVHSPFNPPSKNLLKFSNNDISPSERDFLNTKLLRNPNNYKITPEILSQISDLYDGEINFIDEFLNQLFSLINNRFKNWECLIIITSDHGESFYEHGFFHHQGNIFDELLKIPLFIIDTSRKNIKKFNSLVDLMDVPSTILEYFGITIPDVFQGNSLLPIIRGETQKWDKPYIISECYQKDGKYKRNAKEGYQLISIRSDKWKYIYDEEKKKEYFYNLIEDSGEKNDLINTARFSKDIDKYRLIKNEHLQVCINSDERFRITKAIQSINLREFDLSL